MLIIRILDIKTEIENGVRKLQAFMDSKNDYKKTAYELKKDEIKALLEQSKHQQSGSKMDNQKQNFFQMNNPLMWLSGIGIVGFVVGIILVVRNRHHKKIKNQ